MKLMPRNLHRLFVIVQSGFIMSWLHYLAPTDSMFCVYALCAIGSVFCMYESYLNHETLSSKEYVLSVVVSCIISLTVIFSNYHLFEPVFDVKVIFGLLCCFVGGVCLFNNFVLYLLRKFPLDSVFPSVSKKSMRVFWFCFGIICLVNLFYLFVVEYPGIISNDTITQLRQILSGTYTNHHPYWHTVIIRFFFNIGNALFHDYNHAMVFYSVWQILFMAFAFSYTVLTLYQAGIPTKMCGLVFAVFAFMPYNITHSIYATKDVIFSGAALIFVVSLYRILYSLGKYLKLNYVLFAISGICFSIWRSNGIISCFICLIVFSVFLFKKFKPVLMVLLGVLVVSWIMTNPVLSFLGVKQPDTVEALSIPVQQVARVIYDGRELTEDEYALIDKVVDIEEVPELYIEWLSDPIKDEIRSKDNAYFEQNISQYAKLWVELGLKYPLEYFKAWVDQTKGYWNGGYDYFIHVSGVANNDLGFEAGDNNSIFAKAFRGLLRISRGLIFLDPFESIGLHVWLLLILMYINWRKGRLEFLLSAPALGVILTLLIATPVYSQFRYAYPVFTTFPFVLSVSMYRIHEQ